jgi:uncharacterized protein (DUF427 family)
MSARMLHRLLGALRHEPTRKRVRATLADDVVVDTTGALLVWEPRRVLPSYAVPVADLSGELVPAHGAVADAGSLGFRLPDGERVLDPTVPFAVHTVAGESLTIRAGGHVRHDAAFRAADPDLADHVLLDFDGFDAWYEEDERVLAHPRDPFHRIDVLPSSRDVRIELDGTVLAHSTRPHLLFDGTVLPVRYYLPREDVRVPLRASPTRTFCPYKGDAVYWTPELPAGRVADLAWSYPDPLREVAPVAGLIAFFNERVDVILDGKPQPRPSTPWS